MKFDENMLRIRTEQMKILKKLIHDIGEEIQEYYTGRAIVFNEEHIDYEHYYDFVYRKHQSYPEFVSVPLDNPGVATIQFVDYTNGAKRMLTVPLDSIKLIE